MKRGSNKSKGLVKGAPSGFVISLLIHGAAFMLAGLLVVFTVHQKAEKKFVPPKPVDRPKMKLKKPKVKVKKTAKPKSTTRIVTKVKRASMPDIQLPEMSGMADGLAGGIGGFDIMPDLSDVTLFGGGQTIGNDFEGVFYDFKRDRQGRPMIMDPLKFMGEVTSFIKRGWRTSVFSRYYRSPKKLHATCFMVPNIRSSAAPSAFGESDTGGWCWLAHYKGDLVYPEDITMRFRGMGDDILVVRVNNEVVLNASWPSNSEWHTEDVISSAANGWQSSSPKSRRYQLGNNTAVVGDWITLKAGEPQSMEVLIGEVPGGNYAAMLTVEVEGEDYPRNYQGGPILPMFKTDKPSHDLCDKIYEWLVEDECSITNGPVFRDFIPTGQGRFIEKAVDRAPTPMLPETDMRIWTTASGKTMEAEFISLIGDKAVLKNNSGKQVKIPQHQLSQEDRDFMDLSNPPEFKIDFVRKSEQRFTETTPYLNEASPKTLIWTFGAKVRQTTSRSYNHPVKITFYAIGQQYLDSSRFVLLERRSETFIPTKENDRSYSFSGDPNELMLFDLTGQSRGIKPSDYLIILQDSNEKIIQYDLSSPWIFENLESLVKLPVGAFMDKTCSRVYPTGPDRNY